MYSELSSIELPFIHTLQKLSWRYVSSNQLEQDGRGVFDL